MDFNFSTSTSSSSSINTRHKPLNSHHHPLTEISNVTVSASINTKTKLIEKQTVTLKKRHLSETASLPNCAITTSTTTYLTNSTNNPNNSKIFGNPSPNNKKRSLLRHHYYGTNSSNTTPSITNLKTSFSPPPHSSSSSNNGRTHRKKRLMNLNLEVSPVKKFSSEVSGMKNSTSSYSLLSNNSMSSLVDTDNSVNNGKEGSFLNVLFGSHEKKFEFSVMVDQFRKKLRWNSNSLSANNDEATHESCADSSKCLSNSTKISNEQIGVTHGASDVINNNSRLFHPSATATSSENSRFFIEPTRINYNSHHQTSMNGGIFNNSTSDQTYCNNSKEYEQEDEQEKVDEKREQADMMDFLLMNDTLMDSEDEEVATKLNNTSSTARTSISNNNSSCGHDIDDGKYFHFEPFEHFLGSASTAVAKPNAFDSHFDRSKRAGFGDKEGGRSLYHQSFDSGEPTTTGDSQCGNSDSNTEKVFTNNDRSRDSRSSAGHYSGMSQTGCSAKDVSGDRDGDVMMGH